MRQNYTLQTSFKTKLLNLFRRIFTVSSIEKLIQSRTKKNPDGFFRKLIPPDYLYPKGSLRYIETNGIRYKLDISNVVDHYLYFGIHDSDYSSIEAAIKKASVILDIGGNIGTTALFFASVNHKARILAFEPHPKTFERASENVALNSFKNIDLVNIGLGEKMETVKLYEVNKNNPGMNRILKEEEAYPFKLVMIEKLDDFLKREKIPTVELIKIDVEGFELSVLKGGEETIRRCRPVLFIELDDDNLRENNTDAASMIELLQDFGYSSIYRATDLTAITSTTNFQHAHYDIVAK
jgi:FkbM family methyltransferase